MGSGMINYLSSRRRGALGAVGALGLWSLACNGPAAGADRRLLSEAPLAIPSAPLPSPTVYPPVRFPQDEGPHDVLTEWWYYTGHLYAGDTPAGPGLAGPGPDRSGDRRRGLGSLDGERGATAEYGFEFVFFRGLRGDRPAGYAAHFAITDLPRQRFQYDQRVDVALNERALRDRAGQQSAAGHSPVQPVQPVQQQPAAGGDRPVGVVSVRLSEGGFDLALGNWRMRGREGSDRLSAAMPGYTLEAGLTATRLPALHLGEPPVQPGLITYGPAGYSYYYTRTRMTVDGTLEVGGGPPLPLRGQAWMDHQWGDFLILGGGGWDWFAGNLADGRDLMLYFIRDASGSTVMAHGTLVTPDGEARNLPSSSFTLDPIGTWTSPHTGVRYPSGWRVQAPSEGLDLLWTPLLADQELDTRTTTGVIYWEGAIAIQDTVSRADLGRGYVELTGYTPGGR